MEKESLLQIYEISVEELDYKFIGECIDPAKIEKILLILKSGEEGYYPHLVRFAESRLRELDPSNHLLLKDELAPRLQFLPKSQKDDLLNEIHEWLCEVKGEEEGIMDMPYIRRPPGEIRPKAFLRGSHIDLEAHLEEPLETDSEPSHETIKSLLNSPKNILRK